MKTKYFIVILLVILIIIINLPISARGAVIQNNYTLYLPIVLRPWRPILTTIPPPGGDPETCNSSNCVRLQWTPYEPGGIPYYEGYRVEESLDQTNWEVVYETSINKAVLDNALPYTIHYYRVYGFTGNERSLYSNILPIDIFWKHGYDDLLIWGDENGGVVNVSLPLREDYARIYFTAVPGSTIDPPPGSVQHDEWYWYLDFQPGQNAGFSTTWTKTDDCPGYLNCLTFLALSSPWQDRLDEVPISSCIGFRGWP